MPLLAISTIYPRRCTSDQRHQIDRLTIELGLGSYAARNAYVSREVGRRVQHLIELSEVEARAVAEVLKVEVASIRRPEATRTLCSTCAGTGKVCKECGKAKVACIDLGGGGHFHDPVKCGECEGRRFED